MACLSYTLMMALGGNDAFFEKARQYVRDRLSLRYENSGSFRLLGRTIIHRPELHEVEVNQKGYVEDLKQVYIPAARRRNAESRLGPKELTQFRSIVQQLAWPARATMPSIAYDVAICSSPHLRLR